METNKKEYTFLNTVLTIILPILVVFYLVISLITWDYIWINHCSHVARVSYLFISFITMIIVICVSDN